MAILDTGWVAVSDGQTTQVTIPKGRVASARVRWMGREKYEYQSDSNSSSGSGSGGSQTPGNVSLPTKPDGWAWDYAQAYTSVSGSPSADWLVSAAVSGELKVAEGTGSGGSATATKDGTPSGSTTSHSALHDSDYSYTFRATARFKRLRDTENPQITVAGQVAAHVGTLEEGEVSDWYSATGFIAGTSNDVLHDIAGSDIAYFQIEVTYIPALTVTPLEPEMFGRATRESLVFRASPVVPEGNMATVWFPQIIASQSEVLENPDYTWDASLDQTGWEYWDSVTEAWVSLIISGAPIDAAVRFTPPAAEMGLGRWYWAARGWDDDTEAWGELTSTWQFRIVLTLVSRFACEIAGVDRTAQVKGVVISETTNGELGSMTFQIHVPEGQSPPSAGDEVVMGIRDAAGQEEQFEGAVREIPGRLGPGLYRVDCKLPDAVLAARYVLEDYTSQDVGLVIKDIIDTYCAPLLSTGVDTSTGFVRPVAAFGKTALDVLKELREQYGLLFWVTSTTGVVYLMGPSELQAATLIITRGGTA